ncbi:MAG: UvrD-helicase domain-containing protein [Arenicellales bacterium WSBS_2016_MAG_OTU3]
MTIFRIKVNLQTLNKAQKQALVVVDKPLLILAGAGSGKTRVITEKIARLLNKELAPANKIFAVTFTNKAAREMRTRALGLLPNNEQAKSISISTFHSLGLRILRKEYGGVDLRRGFSLFDPADSRQVVSELMRDRLSSDNAISAKVQSKISWWKNEGLSAAQITNIETTDPIAASAARIFPEYQKYIRVCNAVDLDDLIWLPAQLFQSEKEILQHWRERIDYLLVDEYQDTNGAQYELVKQLVGNGSGLTVVGDDDQSIYAWRGACSDNLQRLREDFPSLQVVKLEQNYRSAGRILKAANALIQNNPRVFDKSLWSELGYGDPIRIVRAKDDEREAESIVSSIVTKRFQKPQPFSHFAILYRGNHQARVLEKKLQEMQIPYRLSGGQSFFDRSEVRDVMSYLRFMVNQRDDTAFIRIINTPRRGIGAGTIQRLGEHATQNTLPLFEAASELIANNQLGGRQSGSVKPFIEWLYDQIELAQTEPAEKFATGLLSYIEYESWLQQQSDKPEQAERRWRNVLDLVEWIGRLSKKSDDSLAEVLSKLLLSGMLDDRDDENADQVSLMTMHAAKGLEFEHVYITGVEEGLLPHRTSVEEDNVEEERRLFYVGITRAKRSLTLSMAMQRKRFGEMVDCEPSRFLEELPQTDLSFDADKNKSPEEIQQTGRAHLSGIRNLLSA